MGEAPALLYVREIPLQVVVAGDFMLLAAALW